MPIVRNPHETPLTLTTREVATGRDVETFVLQPGCGALIEMDSDHQLILSPAAREPETPVVRQPVIRAEEDEGQSDQTVLVDAPEDTVRGLVKAMVETGENLTVKGVPDLKALNAKLQELGFNPMSADQRDAMMPQKAEA